MGVAKQGRKVIRLDGHRPFGGDPLVDRNGISTENHMQIFARLVKDGPFMHNPPKERVKRSS